MYLVREHTGLSYPALGRIFRRDHTTVVYAHQIIGAMESESRPFAQDLARIEARLKAPAA
jgi:chromosomal replication initiation ATPase DnaA